MLLGHKVNLCRTKPSNSYLRKTFPVMFLLGCFLVIMSIYKTYILENLKKLFFLSC